MNTITHTLLIFLLLTTTNTHTMQPLERQEPPMLPLDASKPTEFEPFECYYCSEPITNIEQDTAITKFFICDDHNKVHPECLWKMFWGMIPFIACPWCHTKLQNPQAENIFTIKKESITAVDQHDKEMLIYLKQERLLNYHHELVGISLRNYAKKRNNTISIDIINQVFGLPLEEESGLNDSLNISDISLGNVLSDINSAATRTGHHRYHELDSPTTTQRQQKNNCGCPHTCTML